MPSYTSTYTTPFAIGQSEFEVTLTYTLHPGYPGSRWQPPEDASVEVTDIVMTTSTDKRWAPKSLGTGAKVTEIPDWLFELIADEFEDQILASQSDPEDDRADYERDKQIDRELMEG